MVFGGRARCGNRLFEFGLYSCGTRSYGGGLIRHRSVPGGWYIVCMMVWIMRIVCQNTEYRILTGLDSCLRRNDPRLRHAGAGSRVCIRRPRPGSGSGINSDDRVGAEVLSHCDGFGIIRVPDSSAALRFARNDKSGGPFGAWNDPRLRHAGAGSRVWIRRLRPNRGPAQSLNDRVGAEVFSRCDGFGIIRVPDSSAALRFARNDKSGGLSGPGMTPAYDMRGQAQGSGFGVLVPDRGPG